MLGLVLPVSFLFGIYGLILVTKHHSTTGLKQEGQMAMDFLPLTQYLAVFQGPTSPLGY